MRKQTFLYSLAQALSLTSAVIGVSISPIVGKSLAPYPELATLPYGTQFASVIACSYLLSMSMKRFGRRPVFFLGAITLALGGLLGALSIYLHSFTLNLLGHALLGVTISAFAYFRFAATDGLDDKQKAKAISYVTLGGIAAAFIGPKIAQSSRLLIEDFSFSASYLSFTILALLVMLILLMIPKGNRVQAASSDVSIDKKTAEPSMHATSKKLPLALAVAIYASGFGYMLMALLMMQSSLKMNEMGVPFADIMIVIQYHVVAMFLPSLFMGRIISMIGVEKVILAGYITMFSAMLVAIFMVSYTGILIALIGVGLGWNMLYVGGSSLVATLHGDAHKMQGINESAVAVLNTIGALSAGFLFQHIGWESSNWLAMSLLLPGLILLIIHRWQRATRNINAVTQ
ncbi:MAG: MFS transporter [Oceanospirillaceae bacterium]